MAENITTEDGEVIVKKGTVITTEIAKKIEDAGVSVCTIYPKKLVKAADEDDFEEIPLKVIGNGRVDADLFIRNSFPKKELKGFDINNTPVNEKVRVSVLREIIEDIRANADKADYAAKLESALEERKADLMPRNLTIDDIYAFVSYYIGLHRGVGKIDNIDHLGNRRVRSVGELLQSQLRTGIARVEKNTRDRISQISSKEGEGHYGRQSCQHKTAQRVIQRILRFITAVCVCRSEQSSGRAYEQEKTFSFGPGRYLKRELQWKSEISTPHYGRMCTIETPEGQNIGLMTSLAIYARINKYGFIETPYRRFDKDNLVVTDEVRYMAADEEDDYNIAQAK